MISLEHVTKQYNDKIALKDLNLNIPQGKIFGFLGHNGAGKSTTIKCLTSVIEPSSGDIYFDTLSLKEHRQEIKQQIGYVPDTPDLFLQLSANEYWQLIEAAYHLDSVKSANRKLELIQLFAMEEHVDEILSSFSHGMRQKTIVIGALLSDPDIWILDEPLQGLDPQAAFDLKELMKDHVKKGKTVIFSTHVLDTAQQLCDELAILKQGELLYKGSVTELLEKYPGKSLETIYLHLIQDSEQTDILEALHES